MKIVLTGAGGLLGREVWRSLEKDHDVTAVGRTPPPQVPTARWRVCDLTQEDVLHKIVTRENPELVIHTAAFNDVDGAESRPDDAYRGNALVCRNLALACQRFDAALMSVSTDYVFDGEAPPSDGYREFDACRPISRYGESKYWGEWFVSRLLNKFFIVRTSWLFGPSRATWVDKVAAAARDGADISAVTDMVSSPTYTPDLADAMAALSQTRHYGIYHLTNQGACTRVELAEAVARRAGRSSRANIRRLTQDQLKLPARRPAYSRLDNLAWRLSGRTPLRPWSEALTEHLEKASLVK